MMPQSVIIHERLNVWAKQLRPRLADGAIDWTETRSGDELARAAARTVAPVIVIDLGEQPVRRLEDIALARRAASEALILVLEPRDRPGVPALARELGATCVIAGVVIPPEVVRWLTRWLSLARRRDQTCGWTLPARASDPWDTADSFLPDTKSARDRRVL